MQIRTKRVYEPASPDDGTRILVDRLWPRGLSKRSARVDRWLRETAPSTQLRQWFHHESGKWTEFRRRYFRELRDREEVLRIIREEAARSTVTLVFAARDPRRNNATALREYLLKPGSARGSSALNP